MDKENLINAMASDVSGIKSGWMKVSSERVYPITHAQSTKYAVNADGKEITVYDKAESIVGSTIVQVAPLPSDCNNFITQGIWFFISANGQYASNLPGTCVNGWLHVLGYVTSSFVKQIFYRLGNLDGNDFEIYTRTYNKTTKVWSGWTELLTRETKVCASFYVQCKDYVLPKGSPHTAFVPLCATTSNNGYYSTVQGVAGIKIEKAGTYLVSARAIFKTQTGSAQGYRSLSIARQAYKETTYNSLSTGKQEVWGHEGNAISLNSGTVARRCNVGDRIGAKLSFGNSTTSSLTVSPCYVDITYLGA